MTPTVRLFHWMPRILCIAAILFISLFALDSFDPKFTLWQQILGFMIHLIPSFILVVFLVIAWKFELPGGIIFAILGLGFSPIIFSMNYRMNHSLLMSLGVIAIITIPFVIIGGLFIVSHYLKKKNP